MLDLVRGFIRNLNDTLIAEFFGQHGVGQAHLASILLQTIAKITLSYFSWQLHLSKKQWSHRFFAVNIECNSATGSLPSD